MVVFQAASGQLSPSASISISTARKMSDKIELPIGSSILLLLLEHHSVPLETRRLA